MSDVVALTYDTLPALSNLRREIDERGHVRISLPAGEPGTLARRSALNRTAWTSVVLSAAITSLGAAMLFPVFLANRPQSRALIHLLLISVGVFFSAMFLLVWWLEYRKRMDVIERAALQATIVSVMNEALLIETVGPFGTVSATIESPFKLSCGTMPGTRADCLHVEDREHQTTHLFPGLSTEELRWIAAELHRGQGERASKL
ncbi:hypothetical protein BH09PLA1_BH09PLA1_33100 [soil metagenome]